MTNWTDFSSLAGARVTTWLYDGHRGWLTNKLYDDGHGPSYTYTYAGRLASRTWARGIITSYSYDGAGSLTNIAYSDSTPSVTNTFDRLGRQIKTAWSTNVECMYYDLAGDLLSDSFSAGILAGLTVTNHYDSDLRRDNLSVLSGPSVTLSSTTYGYDNASRLQTVDDGNSDTATYSYVDNSPLVSQILFKQGSNTRMTTTKTYDHLNRLTQISSVPSASSAVNFSYSYNTANQRTKNVLADGSYWVYSYDTLGQVTGGDKYFADGTAVPGQQFGYGFDDIGNRKQTSNGGNGENRVANYTVNNLNQITQRDYPGTNDVIGVALATNAVTVNGQTAWRKGEYFWSAVKSNNTVGAQWEGVRAVGGSFTNYGNLLVPQTPQTFIYDTDGNLVSDGLWTNVWNAENRLIETESLPGVPSAARMKEEWDYLPDGRWSERSVSAWNGSAYTPQYTNHFAWDGKMLVAITGQTNGLVMSFMRGLDLSGSISGACGVGGLLAVSFQTNGTHVAAFDGNGNVAALVSAGNGANTAKYEYGDFGEPIRITGTVGNLNPIRFSTQYEDSLRLDLKYLYRHYSVNNGSWENRDPLTDLAFTLKQSKGETLQFQKRMAKEAALPAYLFARNDPVGVIDCFGLKTLSVGKCEVIVFYGHGTQGYPDKFDFAGPCSAATFIGCFDAEADGNISSKDNQIPGVPTTDVEIPYDDIDEWFVPAWNAAVAKAGQMCMTLQMFMPFDNS
ncbi:MAG TPA: hypothetical protein VG347_03370 [Verrucomicrobiae bacterium]|nr:hypothetical protein [Verrucomicrobiae bacterium]